MQSLLSYCIHFYFCISVNGIVVAFYFCEDCIIIMAALNWLDITSTFLTVTMFVIVDLRTVFYTSCADMFTVLPVCRISCMEFQWLISSHCQTKS